MRMQKTLKPEDLDSVDRKVTQLTKERDQIKQKLAEEKYRPGTSGKMAASCLAGAYTRPLFSSTSAISDKS